MKIPLKYSDGRGSQSGSAVIAVMAMIAIMIICVNVNLVAINTVDRELKLLEKKQVQHWQPKPSNPASTGAAPSP